jgi:hypothetical protein
VAFDAATLNMAVLPLETCAGLAEMFTDGAGGGAPGIASAHPVMNTKSDRQDIKTIGRR